MPSHNTSSVVGCHQHRAASVWWPFCDETGFYSGVSLKPDGGMAGGEVVISPPVEFPQACYLETLVSLGPCLHV